MSAGFPTGMSDINNRAGLLAMQVRDILTQVQHFKAWLDTQTDAQLTALGFAQADVNTLRSAYTDLDKLRQVYQGIVAQGATAYDFTTFAKLLTGTQ